MDDLPLVSIIIPTYNRQQFVLRAVQSALNQTFQDIEVVVVDDGSDDNTELVLGSIDDERIKILKHDNNLGSPAARNTGIAAAKGQYIAFLDSDDEWYPDKLEKQIALFGSSHLEDLGAVNCGLVVDSSSRRGRQYWQPSARGRVFWTYLELREYHDTASMWLIKKEYLDALAGPFDSRLLYVQVSDLLLRLSRLCQFDYIPEPLLTYYDHDMVPRNVLYPLSIQKEAYELYLKKHEIYFQQRPKIHSRILTTFGTRFLKGGLRKESRVYYMKAIRYNPVFLKAWLLLIISLSGRRAYETARRLRFLLTKGRFYQHNLVPEQQAVDKKQVPAKYYSPTR